MEKPDVIRIAACLRKRTFVCKNIHTDGIRHGLLTSGKSPSLFWAPDSYCYCGNKKERKKILSRLFFLPCIKRNNLHIIMQHLFLMYHILFQGPHRRHLFVLLFVNPVVLLDNS